MSGRSQTGQKNVSVRVAMKAQAKHLRQSLRRSPDCSWSHRVHIDMEPVAATGSVGNQNWYFVRGAEGGLLVCVDVVGDVVEVAAVAFMVGGIRSDYNIIC